MKLRKKSELIESVVERYQRKFFFAFEREGGSYYKDRYELLKTTITEKEINDILGNSHWTENKCSECGKDVEVVVQVGQEPDYDSLTAYLCFSCIEKAGTLIKNNNLQNNQKE